MLNTPLRRHLGFRAKGTNELAFLQIAAHSTVQRHTIWTELCAECRWFRWPWAGVERTAFTAREQVRGEQREPRVPSPKRPPAPPLSPGPVLSRKLPGPLQVTTDIYGVLYAGVQAGWGSEQAMDKRREYERAVVPS